MRILITGNLGYIGPVVAQHLRQTIPGATLVGLDPAFFGHCLTGVVASPERVLNLQHVADIRDVSGAMLGGVDVVVNLAAISNDPMGNQFETQTAAINHTAGIRLAREAKQRGVKAFVFASSCSVYGFADAAPRTEESSLDPLTAYARSKVATEKDLADLADERFLVTCLRFATACGWSDRLRLDLVLNDFVASAIASGEIHILSDGTPWRPLIHVTDMARAIEWAARRELSHGGAFVVVNAGSDGWNHQVRDLAHAVASAFPSVQVSVNTQAAPDRRSYRVDFARFRKLAPDHQPRMTLEGAIDGLKEGLLRMGFADRDFRKSQWIRLHTLRAHLESGRLTDDLRWRL